MPVAAANVSAEPRPLNQARVVARTGALMGGFLAVAAAAHGSGQGSSLRGDLPWIAAFAGAALVLLIAGGWLLDAALLGPGATAREVVRGNIAAGITSAGHLIAMAVVLAGSMYGADLPTLAVSVAFALLGLATLALFQWLHRKLTRYADDQEVRGENAAAALSIAGLTVALGVIVAHAAEGSFEGWGASLRGYALALLLAAGLYPVRQLLVKRLLLGFPLSLRGHLLDRAIAEERNVVVGAVEGLTYLGTAFLMTGLL